MRQPTIRENVYRAYWRLAANRQQIFHSRLLGASAPWTDDPILREYKFCNAYRASDRVSQYLIREVIYDGAERAPEDVLLRVVLFRLFSKEATWEGLRRAVGEVELATFEADRYAAALEKARADGPIYTAAFILAAHDAYGEPSKHRNHLRLVEHMLDSGLPRRVARARSLREVYEALIEYPLIGPFMGYQLAIDLNYSELVDFSESEFTVPGPGALRGLRKVFSDFGGLTPVELTMWMVDRQKEELADTSPPWQDLFGRRLQAIDCQNLFCETDKYSRVAFPELRSERSRIKARFAPSAALPTPAYPPKWGLSIPPSLGREERSEARRAA